MPTRFERLLHRLRPETAARLTLPNFLGIGAQKAGTTWLAENLRVHPDVFIPERKELHYFDNKWNRPLSDYAHHFAEAAGQVRGEITPAYGILDPERIRYVARILPDLRLILLLRNPIERAWSHALMDLASRRGRDPAEVPTQEVIRFLESDVAGRRGDYLAILDAWGADFPREQLYVGFFEWIQERPRELLGDVFRHIGVSPEVDWERFPLGKVIVPLVSPDQKGHTVESLEGSGPARSNRHPCPEPVRRWLEAHYADDIERLAERLGGPADAWRSG